MLFFINKKYLFIILFIILLSKTHSFDTSLIQTSNQICSATTYDNTSVTDECYDGPSKRTRVLQYRTFANYMSDHSFKSNGLPFYSSLYVDGDAHNLGDFMNGGIVIDIFLFISIALLVAWIPMLFCWKYRVCIFDECCIRSKCCFCFWNFIIYVVLAAVLSFIIVCIIFAK